MDLREYRATLLQEINISAATNRNDIVSEFIQYYVENMIDAEEFDDFTECFYEPLVPRQRKVQIDGYARDEVDNTFSLFIADFSNNNIDIETLINTQIKVLRKKVEGFIEYSLDGYIIKNAEPSSLGYEISELIYNNKNKITKFKIYILTDKIISSRVKKVDSTSIEGIKVDVSIWDINRMYNLVNSNLEKESIKIDISDYCEKGLPCILATDCKKEHYKSYLTVISGKLLSDIYIKYGSRLLEGNVRSFLSIRGKVNKQIRYTILREPEMFFAYNNGIAATADNVEVISTSEGNLISKIENLQIINGGQTTASIANVVLNDKEDVSKVMVPVKLSVVNKEKSETMIPLISRCANTQNKVSDADFFSNHPYHIRMEEFSRKVYAPAVNGEQYQTIWFYERARGQHVQEQMKLSASERKKYLLKNPKNQIIKKVELAKYINTFECLPYIVSRGSQKNIRYFAEEIDKQWNKDQTIFNRLYYMNMVAKAIIFKCTDKLVARQDWYKQIKAYKANIVTYSIAVIVDYINRNYSDKMIDLRRIWNTQDIYYELEKQLLITTKEVYEFITRDDRVTLNVTEWCKKELCWQRAQNENWTIIREFANTLVSKSKGVDEEKEAKKEQKQDNEINYEIQVVSLGSEYWSNMTKWAKRKGLISTEDESILKVACSFNRTGKTPTYRQSKRLLEIKSRIELEGYVNEI